MNWISGPILKETYRSEGAIEQNSLGPNFKSARNYSTCIYFLLTSETFSAFHRIKQDEIWHFYEGTPVQLHTISEVGEHREYRIGQNFSNGEIPQLVVPAGHWFAARVTDEHSYALVGCTVSPSFHFDDFELPTRKELMAKSPQHKQLITEFTNS